MRNGCHNRQRRRRIRAAWRTYELSHKTGRDQRVRDETIKSAMRGERAPGGGCALTLFLVVAWLFTR